MTPKSIEIIQQAMRAAKPKEDDEQALNDWLLACEELDFILGEV